MKTSLYAAPTEEPVTLDQIKLHLRVETDGNVEDEYLENLITTARQQVEDDTGRKLITQTWDYFLDGFGNKCFTYGGDYYRDYCSGQGIKLPFGNLQSVTYVKYKDSSGTETTMTVTTDYLVETNGDQCGRIVLPFAHVWPTVVLYPSNPISIRFICGYGDATDVPEKLKQAIKRLCSIMYEDRGEMQYSTKSVEDTFYQRLINSTRLFDEFGEGHSYVHPYRTA
jgi:uncharacterized phiE125 gp8 family phage protein